jgi:molecular chaperone DnaJ
LGAPPAAGLGGDLRYSREDALKGKGMSVLRSAQRGTKRQQELLKEFDREGEKAKTSPESEGFVSRVKEFFEDLRE